jgi:hypothetical protein
MIEVLKQALEALTINSDRVTEIGKQREAIASLRQAIKELESQEPVAWKLMPRDATDAMLKAMDECSTEGYDERLYAGHAASVYMAAWDASDTHPPQRTWVGLMRGVRVEGNAVVITVKGGNDEARALCGELINEMEKNT